MNRSDKELIFLLAVFVLVIIIAVYKVQASNGNSFTAESTSANIPTSLEGNSVTLETSVDVVTSCKGLKNCYE